MFLFILWVSLNMALQAILTGGRAAWATYFWQHCQIRNVTLLTPTRNPPLEKCFHYGARVIYH